MEDDFYSRSNIIKRQYDAYEMRTKTLEAVLYNLSPSVWWEKTEEFISPEEFRKRWDKETAVSIENKLKIYRLHRDMWKMNMEMDNERSK